MNIEKKKEYDCSLTDEHCLPYTFKGKKRTDPYLKDGKYVAHSTTKKRL